MRSAPEAGSDTRLSFVSPKGIDSLQPFFENSDVGFEKTVESAIQDAMASGAFENLPGAGRPLNFGQGDALAGDNWIGFRVLQNGGMLPEWLELAREIERDLTRLEQIDAEHAALCAAASVPGEAAAYAGLIARARASYEDLARSLRKRQERFNHEAPGIRSERPAIWIEYHLGRLDGRLKDATARQPTDSGST